MSPYTNNRIYNIYLSCLYRDTKFTAHHTSHLNLKYTRTISIVLNQCDPNDKGQSSTLTVALELEANHYDCTLLVLPWCCSPSFLDWKWKAILYTCASFFCFCILGRRLCAFDLVYAVFWCDNITDILTRLKYLNQCNGVT